MKVISGHQPVYLPWLGLFHKISLSDSFVIMDDAQYLIQDWNNRNKIKGSNGEFWLTIPVSLKNSKTKKIMDIKINSEGEISSKKHWQIKHWLSIYNCYAKSKYWDMYAGYFENIYTQKKWEWLVDINMQMMLYFFDILDFKPEFIVSSEYKFEGYKSDLVLDHCIKLNGELCVLGTHGRNYIDENSFIEKGISIYYQSYIHPTYNQRFGSFVPNMSVIDLLFNEGPNSKNIILSGNITKQELLNNSKSINSPYVINERI